jgi:hypothetical protein
MRAPPIAALPRPPSTITGKRREERRGHTHAPTAARVSTPASQVALPKRSRGTVVGTRGESADSVGGRVDPISGTFGCARVRSVERSCKWSRCLYGRDLGVDSVGCEPGCGRGVHVCGGCAQSGRGTQGQEPWCGCGQCGGTLTLSVGCGRRCVCVEVSTKVKRHQWAGTLVWVQGGLNSTPSFLQTSNLSQGLDSQDLP